MSVKYKLPWPPPSTTKLYRKHWKQHWCIRTLGWKEINSRSFWLWSILGLWVCLAYLEATSLPLRLELYWAAALSLHSLSSPVFSSSVSQPRCHCLRWFPSTLFCWISLMSLVSLPSACLSVRLPSHDTETAREEEEEDQGLGWKEQDAFSKTRLITHTHTHSDIHVTICIQLEDHESQPTSPFIITHWFSCGRWKTWMVVRKQGGVEEMEVERWNRGEVETSVWIFRHRSACVRCGLPNDFLKWWNSSQVRGQHGSSWRGFRELLKDISTR